MASEADPPDAIVLHGPLINPVSPYGLDDFPAFGIEACRTMIGAPEWQPSNDPTDRKFVAVLLELLCSRAMMAVRGSRHDCA
jgi:hypothetical protein